MTRTFAAVAVFVAAASFYATSAVAGQGICTGYGPQTPRDLSSPAGANTRLFAPAPAASRMNLCNIHTHTNAEHKGPGFSVSAGGGKHGGWKCNETASLSEAERAAPAPAMLFIPRIGGRSHDVSEDSAPADIILGAEVLAAAIAEFLG